MARFYFFQENIQGKKGTLTGPEFEHMKKVLRLKPGERVTLFDDTGWEHEAIIQSYGAGVADLEIQRSYQPMRESPLDITLAQAMGKGEKMDWVVEKATELGVQAVLPFVSSYTVPRLTADKMQKRHSRWEKIAVSAAKQSGRTRIPKILELCDFDEVIQKDWSCDLKILFCPGESVLGLNQLKGERKHLAALLLVIGPEGGFTAEEVEQASHHGFHTVQLGKRVLRTETAAVAVLSIVQFLWGDLGRAGEVRQ